MGEERGMGGLRRGWAMGEERGMGGRRRGWAMGEERGMGGPGGLEHLDALYSIDDIRDHRLTPAAAACPTDRSRARAAATATTLGRRAARRYGWRPVVTPPRALGVWGISNGLHDVDWPFKGR